MGSGLSPIWISESCLLEHVCGLLPSNKRNKVYFPCFYTWLFSAECAVQFAENTNRDEDCRMCMIYNRTLLPVRHAPLNTAVATTTQCFLPHNLRSILKPVLILNRKLVETFPGSHIRAPATIMKQVDRPSSPPQSSRLLNKSTFHYTTRSFGVKLLYRDSWMYYQRSPLLITLCRPPLWASGQSSWLQIQGFLGSILGVTRFSEK
jgi:hypothetical protein